MNLDTDADQIDNYYSDTDGSPYEIAIETAYAYGLLPETVLEDPEQDVPCFKPDGKATREFVAYTSVAAAGYEEENEPDHTGWMDWESIAYKNAAFLSVKFDFLRLEDGFFHPADAIDDVDIALISNRFEQLENSVELTQDEIHDDSIVLDTVIKDELTDVMDYTITETSEHTYTVSLPKRSNTEKLASGDVIMLPPNSEYIAGFSVKITDANTAGDQVILTGIAPEIEEVYSKIDFAGYASLMTDKIEAAEGVSVEYDPYGKIEDSDNNEDEYLNSKLKHFDGQATIAVPGKLKFKLSDKIKKSDKLKLTGSVEIEIPEISCIADLDIGLKDGFKANEFTFYLKNDIKFKGEISYNIIESETSITDSLGNTSVFKGRIELGRASFALGATGLSVDIVFFENYSADGSVSISYKLVSTDGIQYKDNSWRLISDYSDSLDFLEVKCSGSLTLGIAVDLTAVKLFDLFGVTFEAGPAFNASFTPHILATDTLYCSDMTLYLKAKLALDSETVVAKFLKNTMHYELEKELLGNNDKNPFKKKLHVENGTIVKECTFGRGTLTGKVISADDESAIQGAKVDVYDMNKTLIRSMYTNSYGTYSFDNLDGDAYGVIISANDYIKLSMYVTIKNNAATYAQTAKLVHRVQNTGTVKGSILDALSGEEIADSTYIVKSGWNDDNGKQVLSGISSDGKYQFELPAGNYTLIVNKTDYTENELCFTVSQGTDSSQNIILAPKAKISDQQQPLRIVLSWGEDPEDLDSHLYGPSASGKGQFHIYYDEESYYSKDDGSDDNNEDDDYDSWSLGECIANLDVDAMDGYGPETITIHKMESEGVYCYYVHDYSNQESNSSNALSASDACVKVYYGDVCLTTFHIPADKYGTLWHVFDYDPKRDEIIPINEFGYYCEEGAKKDEKIKY